MDQKRRQRWPPMSPSCDSIYQALPAFCAFFTHAMVYAHKGKAWKQGYETVLEFLKILRFTHVHVYCTCLVTVHACTCIHDYIVSVILTQDATPVPVWNAVDSASMIHIRVHTHTPHVTQFMYIHVRIIHHVHVFK